MPTVNKITVFVAWPSDVETERNTVFKIVDEINGTIGQRFGVVVEAKDWRSVVGPGAGRPQAVINKAIGTYDIFVGILWKRLGTPSGKAASGFVEEVDIALKAWRNRKKAGVSVLIYIREDSPRTLAAIDTKQLDAVRQYKARLFKRRTLLARAYSGTRAFQALIRQHLTNEVLSRLGSEPPITPVATAAPKAPAQSRTADAKKPPVKKRATKSTAKRAPRLQVPTVKRQLTDADRQAFARRALTASLRDFRAAAKAFNASHNHAEIVVKQSGKEAFTVTADANGTRRVTARVRLVAPAWGAQWTLAYELQPAGFGSMVGGEPYYQQDATVVTDDDGYTSVYRSQYASFADGQRSTTAALDVARLFWDRLIRALGDR